MSEQITDELDRNSHESDGKLRQFSMDDLGQKMRITEPEEEDCDRLLTWLSRSYYVRDAATHEPIPCISSFHLAGLAGLLFSDEASAAKMAIEVAAAYEIETEYVRVTGLWDLFRECASCGCEGVVLDNYYPVTFFNRLSDMDRSAPTLMRMRFPDSTNELKGFFFGRLGVVKVEPGTAIKWIDYEKFDKASNRYVLRGEPLPEPIEAHAITCRIPNSDITDDLGNPSVDVIFRNGASFLGPYVSDVGAVAVFSQKQSAIHFAQAHNILKRFQDGEPELAGNYQIVRVNLFELLDRVAEQHGPFVDIGLNSLSHRFRQGWFFKNQDGWMLETISGVWQISYEKATPRPDLQPLKGRSGGGVASSLIGSGVVSVIDTPFKRVTGANRAPLSEEDANELLDSALAGSFEPQTIDDNAVIPVDAFVIDAFDKITGERFALSNYDGACADDGFLVFPDMIAASAYLIHEILPIDEQVRTNGYHLCHGGGAPGSKDPARESRITANIVAALRKTLLDAMTKGYRPEHGLHIKRLMQDATVSFEVVEIGYFGDLLFYGTSDGGAVEDRVDRGDPEYPEEVKQAQKRIRKYKAARTRIADNVDLSSEITAQLRISLGPAFEMLTVESRVIAATVVDEFNRTGMRPGYDYAGISMKASKLIERELVIRLFRPWQESVRNEKGKDHLSDLRKSMESLPLDRTEQALLQWLEKRSKLDLGTMRFCLSEMRTVGAFTPVRKLLSDYIAQFPDGDWLTGQELEASLDDISTRYRNGGVHEHLVSFEVCREAVHRILLGPQPLLRRLVEATARGEGS
jgi:hypothetical protein